MCIRDSDYVVKPFSARELVARIKAIARRVGCLPAAGPAQLCFGRLLIDEAGREARLDGTDVRLKPREFALLLELASNPGIALSRATLLEQMCIRDRSIPGEKAYEEFQVGDREAFSKTITDADIALFCGVSGDMYPLHVDDEYAKTTRLSLIHI